MRHELDYSAFNRGRLVTTSLGLDRRRQYHVVSADRDYVTVRDPETGKRYNLPIEHVAVVDTDGQAVIRKSLGGLAAPVDLIPKSLQFTIELPKKPEKGWKLVLDPDRRVPEIYEGNNEVQLDDLPATNYARGWY